MSTNSNTPSYTSQPAGKSRKEQLLALLPAELVEGSKQMSPTQTNLQVAQEALRQFGETVTAADLEAEKRRRVQNNRDPQATPSPGAFGLAEARKRFGTPKGKK